MLEAVLWRYSIVEVRWVASRRRTARSPGLRFFGLLMKYKVQASAAPASFYTYLYTLASATLASATLAEGGKRRVG